MASPVDSARVATNVATAAATWNVSVGSPVAGTLLIVALRTAAAPGAITFTGYTQLVLDTSDASLDDTTAIYYRWADGTEGADDVFDPTNVVKGCAICWEITGAANPSYQAPEISTVAVGTTTANTANPGSRAVTGGPKDVLYLAVMTQDGEVVPTVAPTNYGSLVTANSGTAGATNTNTVMAGASRAISASSSDDPGVFTHPAAATGWTAYTIVIHPAAPVLEQEGYRFRNDDGSETAATWRQAVNTPDTIALDTAFRVRFAVENTGADYLSPYLLQFRRKPSGGAFGAWTTVGTTTAMRIGPLSTHYVDSDDTTQQISAGTFAVNNMRENANSTGVTNHPSGTWLETEFLVEASTARGAASADEYELRLIEQTGSVVFGTYTQTPSLTIGTAGGTTHTKAGYGRESA